MHDNADSKFKEHLTTAFYLASKSYDLFICSKNDEKRRLINFVFSNIQLTGKKVEYTLRCPFDIMAKMNHSKDWLAELDAVLTSNYSNVVKFNRKTEEVMGLAA